MRAFSDAGADDLRAVKDVMTGEVIVAVGEERGELTGD